MKEVELLEVRIEILKRQRDDAWNDAIQVAYEYTKQFPDADIRDLARKDNK